MRQGNSQVGKVRVRHEERGLELGNQERLYDASSGISRMTFAIAAGQSSLSQGILLQTITMKAKFWKLERLSVLSNSN